MYRCVIASACPSRPTLHPSPSPSVPRRLSSGGSVGYVIWILLCIGFRLGQPMGNNGRKTEAGGKGYLYSAYLPTRQRGSWQQCSSAEGHTLCQIILFYSYSWPLNNGGLGVPTFRTVENACIPFDSSKTELLIAYCWLVALRIKQSINTCFAWYMYSILYS